MDLRQILAEQTIQRTPHVEPRALRLPASPLARGRHRNGLPIPKIAQRFEDSLDPHVAGLGPFLVGFVQAEGLFEGEQMLGSIMAHQGFLDRLGIRMAASIAQHGQHGRVTLAGHDRSY